MPRFHFHICHEVAGIIDKDEEGMVLPDIAAAETEALEAATELVIEKIKTGQRIDFRFEVTDTEGNLVFVLPFREAVRFC